MRLLNVNDQSLKDFPAETPPYAIASHRWSDDEATYADFQSKSKDDKSRFSRTFSRKKSPEAEPYGIRKVRDFCELVRRMNHEYADYPQYQCEWLWIDTCCINKDSSAELQEAINSMFAWYADAVVCYVYLADFSYYAFEADRTSLGSAALAGLSHRAFATSSWFTRGWTLQELLAPATVVFIDERWQVAGHKCAAGHRSAARDRPANALGWSRNQEIERITGIPRAVLRDYNSSKTLSVDSKMAWMNGRQTTRPEDLAYCTLGLFDVFMPMIYGEGHRAQTRLRREIEERSRRGDPQPELQRTMHPCMTLCRRKSNP